MDGSIKAPDKITESHNRVHYRKPSAKDPRGFFDISRQPAGNLATQRLFRSGVIQPKLAINQPGDAHEQEADRVAEQVMRMPETEQLDRKHESSQAKHGGSSDFGQTAAPAAVHEALRAPGQPLDSETRRFFEPRLGADLGDVRVHTDLQADTAARAIHARAFTFGPNVVFGRGQYQPHSDGGQRLIAHELTHVVQQSSNGGNGTVTGSVQRAPDTKETGEQTGSEPASRDPGAFFERMIKHPNYIDNNMKEVNFFTAELAKIHYQDGSVFDLGLVPRWMDAPVQEVDYHTPREGFRLFHHPRDGGSGYIREADLQNLPRTTSFAEIQKRFYQPVNFFAHGKSGRIVPSRVNALTAPELCKILLDSERRYVEQTRFVAQFGAKVAVVIAGMGGGSWSKGPTTVVGSGTTRLAGRQATSAAVKKLTAEMDDLLIAGGAKKITVEGVEFLEVEVARQGSRLAIKRSKMTVLKEVERGQGKGSRMVRDFEDAAVEVARSNGLKSVTIDVGFITNPGWRQVLESMGYVRNVTNDWVKTIKL